MSLAAVVIGRNEGARLLDCLKSLRGQVDYLIYVDSGSSDGSPSAATAAGAQVLALDMTLPFTAARARNAGIATLPHDVELVQFLDGDCVLREGWLATAQEFLAGHPQVAVVCGRRRERAPEASPYNALADWEWDTPVGEARACGGDALMRLMPLRAVGGYREDLIAGEEPELCLRLRRAGWRIWRLDAEMCWHDAQIMRFVQWWRRSRRAGHAFAEGAALHGTAPEGHWVAETRRAVIWGAVLPLVILLLALLAPMVAIVLALIYPLQFLRLARRGGVHWAGFTLLGKFAEAQGILTYWLARLRRHRTGLIEYR